MKQTTKASKHFPITNPNRHERARVLLFSQPESDWLRQIPAGCTLYLQLLLLLTDDYSQRPCYFADDVLACLPVAWGITNTFIEIAPIGLKKVVRWWAKHRLWDRLFGGSKLRQQGSPTIFGRWLSPTILLVSTLHSREIGVVAMCAGRFIVPEFTHFLRGNHDR